MHLASFKKRPFFMIKETHGRETARVVKIDSDVLTAMQTRGVFRIMYDLQVSSKLAETEILLNVKDTTKENFRISGFPRRIVDDEDDGKSRGSHIYRQNSFNLAFTLRCLFVHRQET